MPWVGPSDSWPHLRVKILIPSCMSRTDFMERHVSQERAVVSTQPCDRHRQKHYLINVTTLVVSGNFVKCKLMCFVCMHVLAQVWMFTYRPEVTLNITPQELSTLFWDTKEARLDGQRAPGIWLSPPSQHWDCGRVPLCPALSCGSGDRTQVLLFVQQAFTSWAISPAQHVLSIFEKIKPLCVKDRLQKKRVG